MTSMIQEKIYSCMHSKAAPEVSLVKSVGHGKNTARPVTNGFKETSSWPELHSRRKALAKRASQASSLTKGLCRQAA